MQNRSPVTQTVSDQMDPLRARAMQAALGLPITIGPGGVLPPFFQHLYFWDPQPPEALGRDGHPKIGSFIPDLGLPRRMWAAGRLVFHKGLRAGMRADRISTVEGVTQKSGRSGPLAFVRLRHDYRQAGVVCLSEWQELVYREDPGPGSVPPPPPIAPTGESEREELRFDSTMLFRYSALTFNGHRIHYDEPYAREVEGYDGLVVHGPLLAQLMMLKAERALGRLNSFSYRATAPMVHTEVAHLCWKDGRAWIRGEDGRQIMSAEAQ
jgi:3-methylfumaryl-CoA hydratase